MKKLIFLFTALIFFLPRAEAQNTKLEKHLFDLPDVSFKKIETPKGYKAAYELSIRQPLDHSDPARGYFYQKVYLSHKSFDAPTVIITEGYSLRKNKINELTGLLKANQIDVEHRFFGDSRPDSLVYCFLNLEQETADLHHINELFRKIYPNRWASTGISKGGATTVFYRYFYPEDVDVSVPYVAPVNIAYEDPRIYAFLDTVGTPRCREKIKDYQTYMLENREKFLPLLEFYALGANMKFSRLTLERAFEYAVLEYPFTFWQWGIKCKDIPKREDGPDKAVKHFISAKVMNYFRDRDLDYYAPHFYQAITEMGYYGYRTPRFKDDIKTLPTDKNPYAAFMPKGVEASFDGSLLKKVHRWIAGHGDRFIYINGNSDPWSACAIRPAKEADALAFFLPGKNHKTARIVNMNERQKKLLKKKLMEWLRIDF
jgi:hypothetical protein